MKILHLGKYCPPFFGGIENFMMDLAEACADKGNEVAAICHHHQPNQAFDKRTVRNTTLYRVPTYGQLMFAPVSPAFGYYLNKVIDEFQPDILQLHMPNTSAFFALFSAKARKLKWIVHWHSDVLGDNSPWFLRTFYPAYGIFESMVMKRAAKVIVTSPPYLATSPILQRFKDKCEMIPLGLSPLPKKTQVSKSKGLRLLMLGRLTFYKGHQYAVEAVNLIKQRGIEDIRLRIVGTGEHQAAIDQQITEAGLSDEISMLGKLPYEQLLTELASADVILLPSIERTEAFGLVLIEAASYGVPAIVSDVHGSGMSWVVQDGETGLVVNKQSARALADAICRLYQEPELLTKLGKNALLRFNRLFAIDSVADETIELYQNCPN